MHGPRYLFALFSAACCTCTALVIFSLSFRSPASLARPLSSFRYLFGPVGPLLGQFLPLLGPLGSLFAALEDLLAALGPLLGALGRLLGGSWPLLGRSWALLGGSWEALGGSWAALGRSWGDLGTTCKTHPKIDAKNYRFGLPKGAPNGTKIGPQNGPKSMIKIDAKKTPLQDHLEAVLGGSWAVLGPPLGSFLLVFHWFLKLFVNIHFFQQISLQEPS